MRERRWRVSLKASSDSGALMEVEERMYAPKNSTASIRLGGSEPAALGVGTPMNIGRRVENCGNIIIEGREVGASKRVDAAAVAAKR